MEEKGRRFKPDYEEPEEVIDVESTEIREDDIDDDDFERKLKTEIKQRNAENTAEQEEERLTAEEQKAQKLNDIKPKDKRLKNDRLKDERLKEKNSKKLEKLMQKKRKRENKSDRKVLTYEDMPLAEREEKQKEHKVRLNKKRIVLASVILLVLVFAVFLFTNSDRLSMHNIVNFIKYGVFNSDSDQRFPVEIQGETITPGNFIRMGQDLCFASETKLQTLNNYGKKMLTTQHGFTTPVLVCSDKYSLVYNLGGTGFQINSLDEHIYTGDADNNIFVADIIDNGAYALVTQSDGYLSKLYVYNHDNEQIYAYSFADYYVTSVSLKSNGKMAVVSGLSALNGSEISSLYVLDFTKDSPVQFVELEDTIIYDVQYLNDTYAAAIGNNSVYSLHTGNGSVERADYDGKTLTAYTVNTDTNTYSVSLSRSGDGRNCEICSFSYDGSFSRSFSTDLRVISISTYKNRVALLTTDSVYLDSKGGDLVSKVDAGIDPRNVVLYTSADAYVLDTSEIRSISM